MKKEFVAYLESVGMTKPLLDRAEKVFAFYDNVVGETIEDLFVSEYVDGENRRVYESLFLFSASGVMEAKEFTNNENYDYTPRPKSVIYWEIKMKDFDLKQATETSRVTLFVRLSGSGGLSGITGEFKASALNCNHLFELFKRYIALQKNA